MFSTLAASSVYAKLSIFYIHLTDKHVSSHLRSGKKASKDTPLNIILVKDLKKKKEKKALLYFLLVCVSCYYTYSVETTTSSKVPEITDVHV